MKHVKVILSGLLILTSVIAQAKVAVAIMDVQRIILSVPEGKEAREKLEKMVREKEEVFKKQREELKKMAQELDNPASLLSAEARTREAKELDQKKYESMRAEAQFQEQIKGQEMQATQKIAITASKLAHEIAKKENFDLIFEAGSSGLIYAKDPIDITTKIITLYKPQDLNLPSAGGGNGASASKNAHMPSK